MKVLVGSLNPVKINCTKIAFEKYFKDVEVVGYSVKSGVSDQPISEEETFLGAKNRAKALLDKNKTENLNADYFVGIEGGVMKMSNKWFELGCFCIIDKNSREAFGTSPSFELPDSITEKLLNRVELGDIVDELTGQKNSKQSGGAIAYFSKNVLTRQSLYESGLISAIVPFLNQEMYFQ
jgi:inosine/xanthosine triphosphatase